MDREMVAPSQLHRELERAKNAGEERIAILISILRSYNLAVIRRIPEILSPLTEEEKGEIVKWGEQLTRDEDISNRDFAFHLMVNCQVSADAIMGMLESNKTYSQSALAHITKLLDSSESVKQMNGYLKEVAEALVKEERIPSRDRGRHIMMTLAEVTKDWRELAERFSVSEISDLRQKVLERFLRECSDNQALTIFAENVAKMCMESMKAAVKADVHKHAAHMHWVLMCLERIGKRRELAQAVSQFKNIFGNGIPSSVRSKINYLFPVLH